MAGKGGKRSTSWKPGFAPNPGGRPKAIIQLVELARAQTEQSIKTLIEIRDTVAAPAAARVGAANAILDRGWGKPAQTITANVNEKRSALDWTTDELVTYISERHTAGVGAPAKDCGDAEPDKIH